MAISLDKIFLYNPFARYFKKSRPEKEEKTQEEIQNSQGISQEELDISNFINYDYLASPGSAVTYIGIQFEQYFGSKAGRIQKYREMTRYPIINDAVNQICDEAIVENADGQILELEINEEMPEHIEDEIRKIWNYVVTDVFKFNERGWDLFRKWLVEAELYIELVLNDEGNNIIGIKVLPAHTIMPIYEENKISGFMQVNVNAPEAVKGSGASNSANRGNVSYSQTQDFSGNANGGNIIFDKDQVAYSNYGDVGDTFLDVRGFLESSIRPYNQLKNMEDALVVHRLVRAPQRRVWNIYTGRMPKGKADEYVKGLIQRYKKKIIYDPETGAMNSAQNVQSLTEDFWFTRDINGNGTTVDTIGGDVTFGEMDDVKYFQENLYKTLMLPKSRYGDEASSAPYSTGKSQEIQREEIKFARMVERMQRRFKYCVLEPFITEMRLRGIDERYIDYKFFKVNFTKSNLFKEYKEIELLESRFGTLQAASEHIYHAEENPSGFFSQEFALRRFFLMTENEWSWNQELLDKEKAASSSEEGEEAEAAGGFGGGEEAAEGGEEAFGGEGGETETIGTEAGGEPIPAPESIAFVASSTDSMILSEWKSLDVGIKDGYNDKTIRNKFRKNQLVL